MVEEHEEHKAGSCRTGSWSWAGGFAQKERTVKEGELNWWVYMTNSVKRGSGTCVQCS